MNRLNSIDVFLRAANAKSFTVAGKQLGLTPSAVSKSVARLEQRLGVSLFTRTTRTISLTVEGEILFERCQTIVKEIDAVEEELAQTRSAKTPAGKLKVSLPISGTLLLPNLTRFMETYPEVELDLDFTDRLVDIVEEGFDLVIRTGDAVSSNMVTKVIGNFQHYLVGSPEYFKRNGTPNVPNDLTQHACLHHRFPNTNKLSPWVLRNEGESIHVELPVTISVTTLDPLIYMAEHGLGIAYIPEYHVRSKLKEKTLVSVLAQYTTDSGVFRALWPAGRDKVPRVRSFIDFICKDNRIN